MVRYYITAERSCLAILARRLTFCQEGFSFNGCRTITFDIDKDRVKWIRGTLKMIEQRSQKQQTVYEVETYSIGA